MVSISPNNPNLNPVESFKVKSDFDLQGGGSVWCAWCGVNSPLSRAAHSPVGARPKLELQPSRGPGPPPSRGTPRSTRGALPA